MLREGELMLKALVSELADIKSLQLTVLLDDRFQHLLLPEQVSCVYIDATESLQESLSCLIEQHDAVWPIAPESDSILYDLSVLVEQNQTVLLNSTAIAVSLCADKLLTVDLLKSNGIKAVNTSRLAEFSSQTAGPWVVKPKSAEGCEQTYLIDNCDELRELKLSIDEQFDYIVQPYIEGQSLSLSCLFKEGRAWLLCCNQQEMTIQQHQFSLQACRVNVSNEHNTIYQQLINQIAQTISGLWGYVGIDIIQPHGAEAMVLEINPRLTTSYAGILPALGLNVAAQVINMFKGDPIIEKPLNKQITVSISKDFECTKV